MPSLRRKPRARSSQVSTLQLDAEDRIIDVIDVDHPFRCGTGCTAGAGDGTLVHTPFIKVPTIEGIQTTLKRNGPAVRALVLTICAVLPFCV